MDSGHAEHRMKIAGKGYGAADETGPVLNGQFAGDVIDHRSMRVRFRGVAGAIDAGHGFWHFPIH